MAKPRTPTLENIAELLMEQRKTQQDIVDSLEREREGRERMAARLERLERIGQTVEQLGASMPQPKRARQMRRDAVEGFDTRLASGTGQTMFEPQTVGERLEAALRDRPRTMQELVRKLSPVNPAELVQELDNLREKERVVNVGIAEVPVWFVRVGEKASIDELRRAILILCSWRPLFHSEIVSATGASEKRVSNELNTLFVRWKALQNLGDPRRRLYWRPANSPLPEE